MCLKTATAVLTSAVKLAVHYDSMPKLKKLPGFRASPFGGERTEKLTKIVVPFGRPLSCDASQNKSSCSLRPWRQLMALVQEFELDLYTKFLTT